MAKKKKKKYSEKPKPPVTTQQTEEITKNPDNTETSNDGAVSQNQQEADTPDTAPVLENETVSSAEASSAASVSSSGMISSIFTGAASNCAEIIIENVNIIMHDNSFRTFRQHILIPSKNRIKQLS